MNDLDPDGSYSVAIMNGNDPLTQQYLSMSEEPAGEHLQQINQRHLGVSATNASMQILPNCPSDGTGTATGSGELYEGDDELGEDTSLAQSHSLTQTGPEDTEGEPDPPRSKTSHRARMQASDSNPSQADDEEDDDDEDEDEEEVHGNSEALDFVHVHLDHLPSATSRDENNFRSTTTLHHLSPANEIMEALGHLDKRDLEQKKKKANQENQGPFLNIFSFYRKFASEGSTEKTIDSKVPEILKSASNANHKHQHQHHGQLNTSIRPSQSSGAVIHVAQERPHLLNVANNSSTYHLKHPHQQNPSQSPTYVEQRQKAIQGDLVYTDSGKGESASYQTDDDSIIPHLFRPGSQARDTQFGADPESHFDFVNMNITDPLHTLSTATDTSIDMDGRFIENKDSNTSMSSNDRRTRYKPPSMKDRNTQNITGLDNPQSTNRGVHFCSVGMDSFNKSGSDLDHNYSQAISQTSEGDEGADDIERGTPPYQKQHKDQRKERLLTKKHNLFRMTLLQTMQHNTRANFCAIFLLGVAMATLVLLIVAKVTSNSHEKMVYDEDNGEVFVVTNNERLMTVEVLAFALIMVLLFGSVCYLATATCNTNNSLVRIAKHEDYLANPSPRRRDTIYNPHARNPNPPQTSVWNVGWSGSKDVGETYTRRDDHDPPTDTDQQSNTGTDYQDLQNHTYSMMSSGSQADERTQDEDDHDDDDDVVHVSMDEADKTICCSPLNLQASTEDLEDQMEDERLASQDDEEDHEGSLAKDRCGVLS